jgi:5,6,7,8-tetrahydromethanopterin hydro-lyase
MARIFISYSRESQGIVEELVQDLNDDGHETWFDQRLTGGQEWWDKILSEIRECGIFVAALTPDFQESRPCLRELNYGQRLQKPVLPVRLSDKIQPESLAYGLAELQCVDYCHRDKLALKMLQRAIRELSKSPPLPDPLPDPPAVPRSYLSTLRERIETDSPLEFKDQAQLVLELRSSWREGGPAEEITDLLQRLRKRDELFAKAWRDIDHLQREIDSGRRGEELVEPPTQPNPAAHPIVNPPVTPRGPEVMSLSPTLARRVRGKIMRMGVGESLVGEGNEVAHIDLIIGPRGSPAETAFANALTDNKDGFTALLALVAPNLMCKPATALYNKVTIMNAMQAVQMFGPAQHAVAKAVVDSVAEGIIPLEQADDVFICVGVFIHWDARDNKKIQDFNYRATKETIARAVNGDPTPDLVVAQRNVAKHPFAAN